MQVEVTKTESKFKPIEIKILLETEKEVEDIHFICNHLAIVDSVELDLCKIRRKLREEYGKFPEGFLERADKLKKIFRDNC